MTVRIPPDPFADWPPLIDSATVPRAVKLRDLLLTVLMWGVLLLILATEMQIIWQAVQVLRGRSEAQVDLALAEFFLRLRPLLLLTGVLVAGLAAATIGSRRRRERALSAAQPAPLEQAILAERAGMAVATLEQARAHRIATVHKGPAGAITVRPGSP